MTALLFLLPLMSLDFNPDAGPPNSWEAQIVKHCQADYTGCNDDFMETGVSVHFWLKEKLVVPPIKYVYGAIPEVDWLTKPQEWKDGLREAIRNLAVNGKVLVYRVSVESFLEGGKRYYQVVILYDV